MMNSLLDDLYDQIVEGVAATRKTDTATVRALIDQGLFLPHEAQEVGLIDHIGYEDDIPHWLESRGATDGKLKKKPGCCCEFSRERPNGLNNPNRLNRPKPIH